jgi:hypothetical protein
VAVLCALATSLLVAVADAGARSSAKYTPTEVAGIFKGAGVPLYVYTVTGLGPGTYTWLRPGVKCAGGDLACVTETTKAQRLFVVVCPSAQATSRVASATSSWWQTTTIGNVVVGYRTMFLYERPRSVVVAMSRLRASA